MILRDYQRDAVSKTLDAFLEHDRVLGVAATGAGKTVLASEIMRLHSDTRCLFLADAQDLVSQCADKHAAHTGERPAIEMGDASAAPDARVVIGTVQSMARRLDKYARDSFGLVIMDEAHRNTLGAQAQKVLGHFNGAQVLGITATPYRSDRKQLGSYYQTVAFEIPLDRLINAGHLSRIVIKSVPLDVDLRAVRSVAGDYREDDLGAALEPHLLRAAELLRDHAADRKTVVFLPLIDTSRRFAEICRSLGMKAVHVDGTDRSALKSDWRVVCNSALLTTGWDCPDVDCVFILRPTKSHALYSQMVGRGTRIAKGKRNLLVLDPLWLSDRLDLIRPARLLAHTEDEAKAIQEALELDGDADLLAARDKAEADRRKALLEKMQRNARKKARTIDAIELAVALNEVALMDYEPEFAWESAPVTDKQREMLERNGLSLDTVTCKGHATKIIDLIFRRRELGLATFKQVKWLVRLGHRTPNTATFEEASEFMNSRFGGTKTEPAA